MLEHSSPRRYAPRCLGQAPALDSPCPAVDNGGMNRHLLLPLVLTKLESFNPNDN